MDKKYMILEVLEAKSGYEARDFGFQRYVPNASARLKNYFDSIPEAEAELEIDPVYSEKVYTIVPVYIKKYKPGKN